MILCLGTTPTVQRSMIFDRVVLDDVNRAIEVTEYASGKSPNVARVLSVLGEEPLATGFAGGARGKFLIEDLDRAGIRNDFVATIAHTRLCTTVIDRSAGIATELVEESADVDEESWRRLDAKMRGLLPAAKMAVFSGSLPPGAPQDFYARWLPVAASAGTAIIIDARGEPLRLALKHGGFIAKLNREELSATIGTSTQSESDLRRAMQTFVPSGGAMVITLGKMGAAATNGKAFWRIHSPKVDAISAVGSGDSFAAGLAAGLCRGEALPDACSLAAACGAANALTALAGHLRREDVETLRREVKLSAE